MNYDQPRQLQNGPSASKWHYTRMNDDRIWPIGYCAEDCPGHDSPNEARAHYRLYLLNNSLRFHPDTDAADTLHRCEAPDCSAYTSGSASLGVWIRFDLCAAHRTREVVEQLIPDIGDSIHS